MAFEQEGELIPIQRRSSGRLARHEASDFYYGVGRPARNILAILINPYTDGGIAPKRRPS
uniref:Uncharacterized protein n=1 Tax=Oryza glumipatula TaxID=40148 RepID=A0A0E0BBU0_9ORYZ